MRVLRETRPEEDVRALERAWSEPETFAFLPAKTAVSDDWVAAALDGLPEALRTHHFALLTSGSTGHPKLVVGARERAERLVEVLHEVQESEAVAETILTLPLSYCYAFVNQWLWARRLGRRLVATAGFAAPDRLGRAMDGARDAMLCLVGAQLPLFTRHFPEAVWEGVVRLHFAGGPFPQAELDGLRRRFPAARIFNNYGCAEAMPRLTLRAAEAGASSSDVGRALPGVELRAAAGGAMEFRSPYGAVAFHDSERGLVRVGPQDWIPTGDHAHPADDGHWELEGRADQVFKRYGEKIALAQLLDTVGAAWKGQAHFYRERDRASEEGYVLVLSPEPAPEDVRAVLAGFRARHPRTHWPLRVESVARLPVLPSGKVDLESLPTLEGKTVHWRNRI